MSEARAGASAQVFQTFNWNWHWANHYLGKPYDEVELLDLVAGYTRARRHH